MHSNTPAPSASTGTEQARDQRAMRLRYADEQVEIIGCQPIEQLGLGVDVYAVATMNLAAQRDPAGYWYVNHMVAQHVRRLIEDGVDRPDLPLAGPKGRAELAEKHDVLSEWWGTGEGRPRSGFEFEYLARWREHVPSAKALWPLQHPGETLPFDGGAIPNADDWRALTHVADAVGIRSRAAVVAAILRARYATADTLSWLSLASGALVPIMKTAHALERVGVDCALELWDLDADALTMGLDLAERHGLASPLKTAQVNLLDPAEFGRARARFDVVETVGFFEYLPDEPIEGLFPSASQYLAGALAMVRPGGVLVLGNMLDTHPQLDFVMRCVQWPYIVPRSLEQFLDVIRAAGVADEQVTFHLPDDGVYAVATIEV
ncbi:MAG: hypothetical protein S0880_22280 [Actinomycetota bacterium]|nr:hypothetical protein [Actinomycetota bacterium]